jgi:hypothetical protein
VFVLLSFVQTNLVYFRENLCVAGEEGAARAQGAGEAAVSGARVPGAQAGGRHAAEHAGARARAGRRPRRPLLPRRRAAAPPPPPSRPTTTLLAGEIAFAGSKILTMFAFFFCNDTTTTN